MSETWGRLKDMVRTKTEIKRARLLSKTGRIEPGKSYFSAHINEMFLKHDREWLSRFDPVVVVVSEHKYDSKDVIVPFIVGPEMIRKHVKDVPNGMAFYDTRVAGIHPYNGGQFALTIILAKVERVNYANEMLSFIEKTAGAFNIGETSIDLTGHFKIAEALMSGVRGLFGLKETTPIMGQRMTYDHGSTPWFEAGTYAIVDKDIDKIPWEEIQVVDGRLYRSDKPFRDEDFVLFSITAQEERSDWRQLQFHSNFDAIVQTALKPGDNSWEKAKAMFLSLYGELVTSPDITWPHAQIVFDALKAQMLEVKKRREGMQFLGGVTNDESQRKPKPPDAADDIMNW
ncbi:hypothetical protein [Roseibium sp.]|uniref:hypothetical protein n=1 Tax=Roseibium sp. TaxID=1936156 RepID=UPI003B50BC07